MGHESPYRVNELDKEIAKEICEAIATHPFGINKLRKMNPHWPSVDTIFKWKRNFKEFAECYALAKFDQIEVIIDQVLDIADDGSNDYYVGENGPCVDSEHINRSRIRIDTRKWLASKLVPKIYGDRSERDAGEKFSYLMQAVIDKL
jgi:hypothetical protein